MVVLAVIALVKTTIVRAEIGSGAAQAKAECTAGRDAKERDVRLAHFKKGEDLARKALAANDKDANAYVRREYRDGWHL